MKRSMLLILCVVLLSLVGAPTLVQGSPPLQDTNFTLAAPQGFGDRQNSWAWAMQWWNGHLYVGTNRAWACATAAANHLSFPGQYSYPPIDPDIVCPGAPDPNALPLQAEIWRWTPPSTWERVYQSPNDVLIPGTTTYTARDVGYRGMTVYTEADGTEALYIGTVSTSFIYNTGVGARILRSADGVSFAPLPQDPGTFLGTIGVESFRNPLSYQGHFYIQGGTVNGAGVLLEADDPRGGNNNFHQVSPPGMLISAVSTFNGFMYLGTRDVVNGYGVYKTDASSSPFYALTPIITNAGYMPAPPNVEVLSMQVFQNHLYVGMNGLYAGQSINATGPAELVRINTDDSWDVVAGATRTLPDGSVKAPISGMAAGFGNQYNLHMWRMTVFDGNLYVGTYDSSDALKNDPIKGPQLLPIMGFDLYRTADGMNFTPVTTTGFGDMFSFGARTLVPTPYGLFVGSANSYYGLKVYLGTPPGYQGFHNFLPLIMPSHP